MATMRQSGIARRHDRGAGEPGQSFVAERAGRVAPPAVLLQPERRCAVGPGERQPEDGGAEHPGAERGGDERATVRSSRRRCRGPSGPACVPTGIGRFGSLMASTWRSNQSLTAWLVAHTSGPASTTPESDRPASGLRRQPGGNNAAAERPHRRKPGDGFKQLQDGRGHAGRRPVRPYVAMTSASFAARQRRVPRDRSGASFT